MVTSFAPDDVPVFPRGVRLHQDGARGRTVLLAPERLFELEGTSVDVLSRIDGTASVRAIAGHLAELYGAPAEVIEADILALFDDLAGKRALAKRSGADAPP